MTKKSLNVLFVKPYASFPNLSIDIPLGPLYLSAYLKKHLGDRVRVDLIDLRIERQREKALAERIRRFKPDMVGVSLMAFEQEALSRYVEIIRRIVPAAMIVVGGPHATCNYADILRDNRGVDCVAIGEGEAILLNLARTLFDDKNFRDVRGVAFLGDDSVQCNPMEPFIEDLDAVPLPDYDLIRFESYWADQPQMNGILAERKYVPLMSSRACPYHCIYCHNIFGKRPRKKSPEHFIDEIKRLYFKHGAREFHIIDDIFNIDRERMHRILNGIIESGMHLRLAFPNAMRGDLLNREDIDLLKRAGAYMITFAVESASARIQTLIRKNLDVATVMENIAYADSIGLLTRGFFMLGFPGESQGEIRESIDLALQSRLDLANFFEVVPFKGTALYELAAQHYGRIDTMHHTGYLSAQSCYQKATGFDLKRLINRSYFRFYRPARLGRLFAKAPRKYYLIRSIARSAFWNLAT